MLSQHPEVSNHTVAFRLTILHSSSSSTRSEWLVILNPKPIPRRLSSKLCKPHFQKPGIQDLTCCTWNSMSDARVFKSAMVLMQIYDFELLVDSGILLSDVECRNRHRGNSVVLELEEMLAKYTPQQQLATATSAWCSCFSP